MKFRVCIFLVFSLLAGTGSGAVSAQDPAVLPELPLDREIRDIYGPREIPRFTTGQQIALLLGAAGAATALIALAILVWRRPGTSKEAAPPDPLVTARLALKEADRWRSPLNPKAYSAAVSDAVRHYLEDAHSLPAPERTTEEFLLQIRDHPHFKDDLNPLLSEFLVQCDRAKFARWNFGPTEADALYKLAESVLNQAEVRRHPPPSIRPS